MAVPLAITSVNCSMCGFQAGTRSVRRTRHNTDSQTR
jgi:hypothetical protein